jgi:hypothetical protein
LLKFKPPPQPFVNQEMETKNIFGMATVHDNRAETSDPALAALRKLLASPQALWACPEQMHAVHQILLLKKMS